MKFLGVLKLFFAIPLQYTNLRQVLRLHVKARIILWKYSFDLLSYLIVYPIKYGIIREDLLFFQDETILSYRFNGNNNINKDKFRTTLPPFSQINTLDYSSSSLQQLQTSRAFSDFFFLLIFFYVRNNARQRIFGSCIRKIAFKTRSVSNE